MNREYADYWELLVAIAAARVNRGGGGTGGPDEVALYAVEVTDAIVRRLRELGPKIE